MIYIGITFVFLYLVTIILYTILEKKDLRTRKFMETNEMQILLQAREDARDEIKQRIAQRDNFAVQYTVIILALLTLALSNAGKAVTICSLALIPIISLFYSFLLDSSYRVHERLVEYLNTEIEPKIEQIGKSSIILWEHYCKNTRLLESDFQIGGRKMFFHIVAIVSPIIVFFIDSFLYGISFGHFAYAAGCTIIAIMHAYRSNHYNAYTGLNNLAFCDYERKEMLTDDKNKALFLDRDGTLHVDKVMTHRLKDLQLLPGAKKLVKEAHDKGYKVIIITNQSAIGKGYYSEFRMHLFNAKLRRKLKYVDAIYYCPHTKEAHCRCRKPNTGMIDRATFHYNLDLEKCILVGDQLSDALAGRNAGIKNVYLVTTGIYKTDFRKTPEFVKATPAVCRSLGEVKL